MARGSDGQRSTMIIRGIAAAVLAAALLPVMADGANAENTSAKGNTRSNRVVTPGVGAPGVGVRAGIATAPKSNKASAIKSSDSESPRPQNR